LGPSLHVVAAVWENKQFLIPNKLVSKLLLVFYEL